MKNHYFTLFCAFIMISCGKPKEVVTVTVTTPFSSSKNFQLSKLMGLLQPQTPATSRCVQSNVYTGFNLYNPDQNGVFTGHKVPASSDTFTTLPSPSGSSFLTNANFTIDAPIQLTIPANQPIEIGLYAILEAADGSSSGASCNSTPTTVAATYDLFYDHLYSLVGNTVINVSANSTVSLNAWMAGNVAGTGYEPIPASGYEDTVKNKFMILHVPAITAGGPLNNCYTSHDCTIWLSQGTYNGTAFAFARPLGNGMVAHDFLIPQVFPIRTEVVDSSGLVVLSTGQVCEDSGLSNNPAQLSLTYDATTGALGNGVCQ